MKNDKTREVGMFKLIWKNLWARRRKNGWLLAELILVSIISWVVLDPVIVVTHDRNIPLGYDAERLCLISLGALQPQAPGYDAEAQDSATLVDNYYIWCVMSRTLTVWNRPLPCWDSVIPILREVRIVNCLPKGIRFPYLL